MRAVDKVIEALHGIKAGITIPEIRERCGLTPQQTRGAVVNLCKDQRVIWHEGDKAHQRTYTLNPDKIEDDVAPRKSKRAAAKHEPTTGSATMRELADKARARNGLAQRHMLTTLKLLEDAIDSENDSDQVRDMFALHKEAIQLAGLA